jgi:cysteine desulfurase
LLTIGLGAACALVEDLAPMARAQVLRDRLWKGLKDRFGDRVVLNGHPEHRLPNTLNVAFAGQVGAELLQRLDGVAASTGSACHAGRIELSPVLKAMGVPLEIGGGAIRFSLGRGTTEAEIDQVPNRVMDALKPVR